MPVTYTWTKIAPLGDTGGTSGAGGADDTFGAAVVPPPRWRHSAVLYGKLLVIFGVFASEKRLNDVWVFHTELKVWEQKHAPSTSGIWEGLPQSRGAHSATLVGESKMVVFGGYGGNGFGRTDFNDLYALDLQTFRWEEITADGGGEKPEPRSGHQACLIEREATGDSMLLVMGGWNSLRQFQDMFAFDFNARTWTQLDVNLPLAPTWNHACVAVSAVPHWKVFMFGGNCGDLADGGNNAGGGGGGAYLNTVAVLDTGSMQWSSPPVKGEVPPARVDTALVFDRATNHLLLFGGWANRWFNDLRVLNGSEIVGPPYAIAGVEPATGPITGSTKLKILGYNFPTTGRGTATVRFAVAKGSVDVQGAVLNATTLQVTAPSFEKYGPLLAEVRVSYLVACLRTWPRLSSSTRSPPHRRRSRSVRVC